MVCIARSIGWTNDKTSAMCVCVFHKRPPLLAELQQPAYSKLVCSMRQPAALCRCAILPRVLVFVSFRFLKYFRAGLKPTEVTAKMGQMWAECSDAQKEVGDVDQPQCGCACAAMYFALVRKRHGLFHGFAAKVEWRPPAQYGIPFLFFSVANPFARRPALSVREHTHSARFSTLPMPSSRMQTADAARDTSYCWREILRSMRDKSIACFVVT